MESQYYRTFIGIPIRVDQLFLQARHKLMAALNEERISWTNSDQYHVTLRFIGDTELSTVKKIGLALHEGVTIPGQTSLGFAGLASFGPRKRPRVIWVGFEEAVFFDLLKLEVDRVLESCGIPAVEQPFRAHLTLGRVRSLQNMQKYYEAIEENNQQFSGPVSVEKLVYFRSILGARGPEYRVLDEILFH